MGSLFKLRDYWYATFPDEEFGENGLAVGNVANDTDGTELLAVGSYQGVLRILQPSPKQYKAEDLLLEANVGGPILHLAVGDFGFGGNSLAVLTPRQLIVGAVVRPTQSTDGNSQNPFAQRCDFLRQVEHPLERTAFNLCSGAFGPAGQAAAEQICVQSMDGQLAFFDHAKLNFARFLPSKSFLAPGPLLFVPSLKAVFTGTSTFEVESYQYATLASSTASETKEERQGRRLMPDWSASVGEDIVALRHCPVSRGGMSKDTDIVVLCEHTLFLFSDRGELVWNKRLDFFPSALATYAMPEGPHHQLLVGSHAATVSVIGDGKVEWCAKASEVPLAIMTGNLCKVQNTIVTLGMGGAVSVNYLGTDPANNPVQVLESKELDYDAMDVEHKRLQQQIRKAINGVRTEPENTLMIQVSPPAPVAARATTVMVHLTHRGIEDLENVVLTINVAEPLLCDQHTHTIPSLGHNQPHTVPITLRVAPDKERMTPSSLLCDAIACYTSPNGEPLTTRVSFSLPLGVVGQPIEPVKNTAFKFQLDTNKMPPELTQLFEDLAAQSSHVGSNIISFQYYNGLDASILVSKNAGRFRIQSSNFEALWLLTSELVRRLRLFYRSDGTGIDLTIDYQENLPLKEYFDIIDEHFAARKTLADAETSLADAAQEFRAIQKRLLVRFRERNPTPMDALRTLFEEAYNRLHERADTVYRAQQHLEGRDNSLTCSTNLVLLLSRYKFQQTLGPDDFNVLRHFLSPVVHTGSGQGWEEATDAAATHLLRTVLSRSAKESATAPQPLTMPTDTAKLQKHLTLVLDRIGKGGTVRDAINAPAARPKPQPQDAPGAPAEEGAAPVPEAAEPVPAAAPPAAEPPVAEPAPAAPAVDDADAGVVEDDEDDADVLPVDDPVA